MNEHYIFEMRTGTTYFIEAKDEYAALKILYAEHLCTWYLSAEDFNIIVDSRTKTFEELCETIYKLCSGDSDSYVERVFRGECLYNK
jgi:hypothetical protein